MASKSSGGMQGKGKPTSTAPLQSKPNSLKPYNGIGCSDGFGSNRKAAVQSGLVGGKRK